MRFGFVLTLYMASACAAPAAVANRTVSAAAPPPSATPIAVKVPPAPAETALDIEDDTDRQIRELERARLLFRTFLDKAGESPEYAEAARRSHERIEDIDRTIEFLREGRPH